MVEYHTIQEMQITWEKILETWTLAESFWKVNCICFLFVYTDNILLYLFYPPSDLNLKM